MALGHSIGIARQFFPCLPRRSHWNDGEHAMKNTGAPWTQEDDEFALTNDRQMTRKAIGEKLGRTKNAVTARLRLLAMTEEEKRAFNTYKWLLRKPNDPRDPPIYRPTPEMLHDRDVRAVMPHRDLTAAFFGDPPLGLSALDGRRV